MGYARAGFEVVGVDLEPQPRYPFTFVQGDALEYLAKHGKEFHLIHASPPCQIHSITKHIHKSDKHLDLVPPTREGLKLSGRPYIIENVVGAPLENPIMLCGIMFDLKVLRHRLFETSFYVMAPRHNPHPKGVLTGAHRSGRAGDKNTGKQWGGYDYVSVAGHNYPAAVGAAAMGIDWMSRDGLSQAIPPAYTEWLARQWLAQQKR